MVLALAGLIAFSGTCCGQGDGAEGAGVPRNVSAALNTVAQKMEAR